MATAKKIMAWGKCEIKIGPTGESDAMATTLTSIGTIKDKSTTLETSAGEVLQAKASGGATVAREEQEGTFIVKTRVIEPDDAIYSTLGLGTAASSELTVQTHVVSEEFSVEISPKNVGAKGIKAPKTSVSFKPGYSEEEGNYLDLEFAILFAEAATSPYWYKRFTKA